MGRKRQLGAWTGKERFDTQIRHHAPATVGGELLSPIGEITSHCWIRKMQAFSGHNNPWISSGVEAVIGRGERAFEVYRKNSCPALQ